jgi:lysine 6-dehydrogenase
MKITIIGAGIIGSALALELAADEKVTQIQVCDSKARALQELQTAAPGSKVRSFQVDARDPSVLEPIIKGSSCVISSSLPELNLGLAQMSLRMGSHFCDLGSSLATVEKMNALSEEARDRGRWIVPNCGLAPGLVNVLCVHAIDQFETPVAAHLRVGDVPINPQPPFNFGIAWSAEKLIDDYVQPVQLIEDGRKKVLPALTLDETIEFPEPFGAMEAFCTAGGLSTLTTSLVGKIETFDHKAVRWPGHASQMRFLIGLGFGEDRSIDVRTHLTYRDVLSRRLTQRLGGFFEDAVLMRVLVKGIRDGQEKSVLYQMIHRFDSELGQTAIQRSTGITAASIALTLAGGELQGGGVGPPEYVIPREGFRKRLAARGLHITKTWFDEYVDVTNVVA